MMHLSERKENLISILDVGKNRIDDSGLIRIEKFSKLNKLYFSYNRVTEEGLKKLIHFLPKMSFLTEISLSKNEDMKDKIDFRGRMASNSKRLCRTSRYQ